MSLLLLLLALATPAQKLQHNVRCHVHEQRCEANCNQDYPGGSLNRAICYDRCREKELECVQYGDDEP
jgi:hypothetical protein